MAKRNVSELTVAEEHPAKRLHEDDGRDIVGLTKDDERELVNLTQDTEMEGRSLNRAVAFPN
jgi:hypothetical protein